MTEKPEPIESVDDRQFATIHEQEANENCPACGCGFIAKYEDGKRICLYCPEQWYV